MVHVTPDLGAGDGPDGDRIAPFSFGFINHGSAFGMSSIFGPTNALLGVFLSDAQPNITAAPAGLSFGPSSINFTSLSPLLKQVFFIGDGVTDGNITQQFVIPVGATRLFLGTLDGFGWFNNSGQFNVNVNGPTVAVPEPTSIAMWGLGALGMMFARRNVARRQSRNSTYADTVNSDRRANC